MIDAGTFASITDDTVIEHEIMGTMRVERRVTRTTVMARDAAGRLYQITRHRILSIN